MKTKWRILFMAFWLLHIAEGVLAQQTGVYLTQHDFDRCHVSYSRKANLKYHFKLNDFSTQNILKYRLEIQVIKFLKTRFMGTEIKKT